MLLNVDPVSVSIALSAIILISLLIFLVKWVATERQRLAQMPPWASSTLFENIKVLQNSKGLTKASYSVKLSEQFNDGDFGRTSFGSTFRLSLPLKNVYIVTTDIALARLILQGNSAIGLIESEKTYLVRIMNFLDRGTNSLGTHLTTNVEREQTRKAVAPCFSTANLQQTWPYIEAALLLEFKKLHVLSETKSVYDCKKNILPFFLGILGRSAFGVEFTSDNTENENNINGLEYLRVQDVACLERVKEASLPIRPYMFWDKGVQEGTKASKTLTNIAAKLMKLHRQNIDKCVTEGTTTAVSHRHSLIDFLNNHPYPNEMARLTDLNVLKFAGHDTTGYTFCFLLMELARNPTMKKRLMDEIAVVMPNIPLGESSNKNIDNGLHHGDQKVLSAICGLEYLNWCIKEAMRLWPVVSLGSTRDVSEDIIYKDMLIPKGCTVGCHYYGMFRERWIDRPHEFLPERWSTENPQLPQLKEMFIPFSVGKRACIGQNMAMFQLRLMGAYFLHNFDFTLAAEPTFEYFVTLKPVSLLLNVYSRGNNNNK